MVRLATATNPFFSTTDLELKRPGTSYSIDTIRHFQKKYQKSLFFIMGRDAFVDIETWKDFQHLFFYCNFIVMTRPRSQKMPSSPQLPEALVSAFQYDQQSKNWIHTSKHALYFKEISYLDISSTKVRKLIQKGRSARYLIPPGVETYIQRYGLYQKGG